MSPRLEQDPQPGADDQVTSLVWAPSGRYIVGIRGESVVVWDETGTPRVLAPCQPDSPMAVSADDKLAMPSADSARQVEVWDLREARKVATLDYWEGNVYGISWLERPGRLGIGGSRDTIKLWDTTSWSLTTTLYTGTAQTTNGLAASPDPRFLASAERDGSVRFWDARTGTEVGSLSGLGGSAGAVAWAPDGRLLASAHRDGVVMLWDFVERRPIGRLEGHVGATNGVQFSCDASLLASWSSTELRFWDTSSWQHLASMPAANRWPSPPAFAFHPSEPRFVIPTHDGTGIRFFDNASLHAPGTVEESVRYITARVVLVGDTGVGKTGLGWRLAHGAYQDHGSTHGQQFWIVDELGGSRRDGTRCEAVLWDLAGQPDYRLVHSLFLDTIDVALLVHDPTDPTDPLAGVEFWLRRLRSGASVPPRVLLVGGRADRGTSSLTAAELIAECRRLGIAAHVSTSAMKGDGLPELIRSIRELISWDDMVPTVTTTTFKRVRDYVLSLKEGVWAASPLVAIPELRRRLQATDSGWEFSDDELATAVRHLETHGFVKVLRTAAGADIVLLTPELLSQLASSIVLRARADAHELGALDEARLLDNEYQLSELDGLEEGDRRLLLDAVLLLFLVRNACFRASIGPRRLLVFPSLINEKRPRTDPTPIVDGDTYTASGQVEHLYATLVVLLGYTNTFTRTHQWQNQAQYELQEGQVCGFRQVDHGAGLIELTLYHRPDTPPHVRGLFRGLFEMFLLGPSIEVTRQAPVVCGNCHEAADQAAIAKHAARGHLFCSDCGIRVEIARPDPLGSLADADRSQIDAERQVAAGRTAFEAALVMVKSLALARTGPAPTCFISYAWGSPDDERWVLQLARDLRNADIDVILDRWHSTLGSDLGRYIERIESSNFVVVIGTPELVAKYRGESTDPVLAAELELITLRLRKPTRFGRRVMPVLRRGSAADALTPSLQTLVQIDFREPDQYFGRLFELVWHLHELPPDAPALETLRASLLEPRGRR